MVPPASSGAVGRIAGSVFVAAIRVDGAQALPPEAFADAIEPYLGRTLSPADLRALTTAVARAARTAGYVFATASIPPQRLTGGLLRVRLDEGRIDQVRISGPKNAALERTLAPLALGASITRGQLERRLLLAGDLPGIRVARVRFAREGGRGILIVEATEDRATGRASIDDRGSKAIGPVRAGLAVDLASLVSAGDRLTVQTAFTPFQPREFGYLAARYGRLVSRDGDELSLTAGFGRSRPGSFLRRYRTRGDSVDVALAWTRSILRRRATSLWATVDADIRRTMQDQLGERVREDRTTTLSGSINGYGQGAGGLLRGRATLVQGLDLFNATEKGDPLASRRDGGGVFTRVELWADWTRTLADNVSIRVAADGQYASRPLLATEELGLGGPRFGRGYDFSERAGDQGLLGSAELRYDLPTPPAFLSQLQLYAYADGGKVSNRRGGFGGGSLASAGGGVRAGVKNLFDVALEAGVPLTGPRYDTGDRHPRLSFTIARSF